MKTSLTLILIAAIAAPLGTFAAENNDSIQLPFRLAKGQMLFEKNCSSCHGVDLNGSDKGPPLLHPYYVPSHHGDASFYNAALHGVKAHHWNFGDMKPVEGMTESKIKSIVPYVRYYQQQKKLY
jgi:mono/diheme cytochrome c family protein